MSSPTYDRVRVLEVEDTRARLWLARVPEPPFDDPLTPGLGLMLLHEAASLPGAVGIEAPILELSVEHLMAQPRPLGLIERHVRSVHELVRRNEAPDFYAECRTRFAAADEARSHEAYCEFYRDESNLFQIEVSIVATDTRWTQHLRKGASWSSTAYAPEIYD